MEDTNLIIQKRLKDIVLYIKNNIQFYNDILPNDILIQNTKDIFYLFNNIMIIDKKNMRNNMKEFISKDLLSCSAINQAIDICNTNFEQDISYNCNGIVVFSEHTSGTSGIPFITLKSANERIRLGNNLWKLRNEFYSVRPKDMFDFTNYKSLFTCRLVGKEEKYQVLDYLKNSKFSWWYINEHALNEFSKYVSRENITFDCLKVIENNGSFIFKDEMERYGQIFSCKIANNYGSREVWNIAYDCIYGHLHVNDNIYLELIDDNGKLITEPNIEGNVIVTSLLQKIMPFIRYNIGDRAYWVEGVCDCGKRSKRLALLPGRQKIKGTEIYGNIVFKNVITKLLTQYNLTKYSEINIVQTSVDHFIVNIKGNQENKRFIEKAFLASAKSILYDKNYIYNFTYDENKNYKNLFIST